MTFGSFFHGFGLADEGALAAGLQPLWGVEYDDDLAAVARANGHSVTTADVRTVDTGALGYVDWFHTSPPCPNFSVAKADRGETTLDVECGEAGAAYVRRFRPRVVSLENVPAYRASESLRRFLRVLTECGYRWNADVLNSADYGTPQTRKRLVLVASRDREPRLPLATYAERPPAPGLFGDVLPRWRSWYEAIEDLLGSLPDRDLADWQQERLPEPWATMLVGQGGFDGGIAHRARPEPALTVTGNHNQANPRAVLVSSQGVDGGAPAMREDARAAPTVGTGAQRMRAVHVGDQRRQYADDERPAFTVRAGGNGGAAPRAILIDGQQTRPAANREDRELLTYDGERPAFAVPASVWKGRPSALLAAGPSAVRTVRLSPRCLGRFQDLPDHYRIPGDGLPGPDTLACKGIGNGMPARLMTALALANA